MPSLRVSKKVEVQEALPPAGVIGAEPLTLVPQHFPPQTSVALFAGIGGQLVVFRQTEGWMKMPSFFVLFDTLARTFFRPGFSFCEKRGILNVAANPSGSVRASCGNIILICGRGCVNVQEEGGGILC